MHFMIEVFGVIDHQAEFYVLAEIDPIEVVVPNTSVLITIKKPQKLSERIIWTRSKQFGPNRLGFGATSLLAFDHSRPGGSAYKLRGNKIPA